MPNQEYKGMPIEQKLLDGAGLSTVIGLIKTGVNQNISTSISGLTNTYVQKTSVVPTAGITGTAIATIDGKTIYAPIAEEGIQVEEDPVFSASDVANLFIVYIGNCNTRTETCSFDKSYSEISTAISNGKEIVAYLGDTAGYQIANSAYLSNNGSIEFFFDFYESNDSKVKFWKLAIINSDESTFYAEGVDDPSLTYVAKTDIVPETGITGTAIATIGGQTIYAPAETDPVFSASPAAGITAQDISTWNNGSTDNKVEQNNVTSGTALPLLFKINNKTSTITTTVGFNSSITANPSSGRLTANSISAQTITIRDQGGFNSYIIEGKSIGHGDTEELNIISSMFAGNVITLSDNSQANTTVVSFNNVDVNGITAPRFDSMPANKKYVDDAIASISAPVISVNGATGNVVLDADDISYSATQSIKDKIDDIVTTGGEPNVIETVKVNGTALTPVNKEVNVIVPTISATSTLSSGTEIGSIIVDNVTTTLYAPAVDLTPYATKTYAEGLTSGLAKTTDLTSYVAKTDVTPVAGVTGTAIANIGGKTIYAPVAEGGVQTETDPVFQASAASEITATDISRWNGITTIVSNVQSDWNATTGASVILNKPTIPTAASFTSIYDSRYAAIGHTHDYSKVTVTQGSTTGITIGTIAVDNNGTTTTTTLYAPNSKALEIIDLAGTTTTSLSYPSGESFATIKGYIDSGKVVYLRVNDYPALHHLHIFESDIIQFVETAGLDTHYITLNDDGAIDYSEQIVTVQDGKLFLDGKLVLD